MLPTTAFANLRAKMGWIAKLIDGSKATEALGEDDETFEQWKLEKMKWAREMKIRAVLMSSIFEFGAVFQDCLSEDPQGNPPFSPFFGATRMLLLRAVRVWCCVSRLPK